VYKISSVEINGFWQKFKIQSEFNSDVNIVIGMNGTGKTTFMNILYAVLSADIDALFENDFSSVILKLSNGKNTKTIKAEKFENGLSPFPIIDYKISTRKYSLPVFSNDDARSLPTSLRRRAFEEASKVKAELEQLVSLASLSVYRIGNEVDPEFRDRAIKRSSSPVDLRLTNLRQLLTHYQLELSTKARAVSSQLQRDVLTSLLYQKGASGVRSATSSYDETNERNNLITAYRQLGVSGAEITRKIQEHTGAINETLQKLKELEVGSLDSATIESIDFSPLEAYRRTSSVIDLSLDAAKKIDLIYDQIQIFLTILHDFIPDKKFSLSSGDLSIEDNDDVTIPRLSSGEKQLLILFIETLLQRKQPYIFLADEPELSLHISWQRKILPAIRKINENAQIIVATHSPEVASNFVEKIIDMEDIRHV